MSSCVNNILVFLLSGTNVTVMFLLSTLTLAVLIITSIPAVYQHDFDLSDFDLHGNYTANCQWCISAPWKNVTDKIGSSNAYWCNRICQQSESTYNIQQALVRFQKLLKNHTSLTKKLFKDLKRNTTELQNWLSPLPAHHTSALLRPVSAYCLVSCH